MTKSRETKTHTQEIEPVLNSLKSIFGLDKEIAALEKNREAHCKNLRTSLRNIRSARGISTSVIAEALGITQGHYSDIERGRRSCTSGVISKLYDWAKVSAKKI